LDILNKCFYIYPENTGTNTFMDREEKRRNLSY